MIYPLTVCMDRYGGCYSGGNWLAFNLYPDEVPEGIHIGDDCDCVDFWGKCEIHVGRGNTLIEAVADLERKLNTKYE